jgi:hypothetical protein
MVFAYDVGMRQSGDNWVQGYCDATFIDMQGAAVLLVWFRTEDLWRC